MGPLQLCGAHTREALSISLFPPLSRGILYLEMGDCYSHACRSKIGSTVSLCPFFVYIYLGHRGATVDTQ